MKVPGQRAKAGRHSLDEKGKFTSDSPADAIELLLFQRRKQEITNTICDVTSQISRETGSFPGRRGRGKVLVKKFMIRMSPLDEGGLEGNR